MQFANSYVDGLSEVRRDLRAMGKEAGREFDREAKEIAIKVRDHARHILDPVKQTGATARSIGVSSTYKGIAVRSGKVNFPQHEYGARVWLRRGLPYPAGSKKAMEATTGKRGRPLDVRQVTAQPGRGGQDRVVNEARYLIQRRRPIGSAAQIYTPVLQAEAERMIARLQARYRLTA